MQEGDREGRKQLDVRVGENVASNGLGTGRSSEHCCGLKCRPFNICY